MVALAGAQADSAALWECSVRGVHVTIHAPAIPSHAQPWLTALRLFLQERSLLSLAQSLHTIGIVLVLIIALNGMRGSVIAEVSQSP